MERLLKRNISLLYINSYLMGAVGIVAPTMVLFQLKTLELSLTQIMFGEALFALAVLGLEIPSGLLADKTGRRRVLLLAEVFMIAGFTVLALAQSFMHILVCQVLVGFGVAAASGAKEALVFDTLKSLGQEETYRKVWSRMRSWVYVTAILGSAAAGFVAMEWGLRAPTAVSVLFLCASLINLLFLIDPPVHGVLPGEEAKKLSLKKSIRYVFKNSLVRYILLFSVVMGVAMKLSFHTLNPYWDLMGVSVLWFGLALALHNIVAAVVSWNAEYLTKGRPDYLVLGWLVLIVAGTFLLMASGINWGVAGVIALTSFFQISRSLWPLVTSDAVNQITYSHHRATVLSIKSFAVQGAQVLLLPLFGYLADLWSLLTAFGLVAIFMLVTGLLTLWPLRNI